LAFLWPFNLSRNKYGRMSRVYCDSNLCTYYQERYGNSLWEIEVRGTQESSCIPSESPVLGLVCDETAGGFLGIEGSPWVYPYPRLIAGLDFTDGIAGALPLPLTTADAEVEDWSFDAASCKWTNLDLAPRFRLSFVDGSFMAVEILAEAPLLVGASFYTENGLEVLFRDDAEGNFAISDQVGTPYPPTFEGAEAEDWIEGGCAEFMGGSHYYKLPFENSNPITPIYDRYGTSGTLKAFAIIIDYVDGVDGQGLDFMGLNPTSGLFGCAFNHCNAEGCIEDAKASTNGSTDIEVGAASTIHLFWDLDPADFTTWPPCQAPSCRTRECTCCGTPDDSFSGHCPPAWPPVFPE
jgi:hypothetical protein